MRIFLLLICAALAALANVSLGDYVCKQYSCGKANCRASFTNTAQPLRGGSGDKTVFAEYMSGRFYLAIFPDAQIDKQVEHPCSPTCTPGLGLYDTATKSCTNDKTSTTLLAKESNFTGVTCGDGYLIEFTIDTPLDWCMYAKGNLTGGDIVPPETIVVVSVGTYSIELSSGDIIPKDTIIESVRPNSKHRPAWDIPYFRGLAVRAYTFEERFGAPLSLFMLALAFSLAVIGGYWFTSTWIFLIQIKNNLIAIHTDTKKVTKEISEIIMWLAALPAKGVSDIRTGFHNMKNSDTPELIRAKVPLFVKVPGETSDKYNSITNRTLSYRTFAFVFVVGLLFIFFTQVLEAHACFDCEKSSDGGYLCNCKTGDLLTYTIGNKTNEVPLQPDAYWVSKNRKMYSSLKVSRLHVMWAKYTANCLPGGQMGVYPGVDAASVTQTPANGLSKKAGIEDIPGLDQVGNLAGAFIDMIENKKTTTTTIKTQPITGCARFTIAKAALTFEVTGPFYQFRYGNSSGPEEWTLPDGVRISFSVSTPQVVRINTDLVTTGLAPDWTPGSSIVMGKFPELTLPMVLSNLSCTGYCGQTSIGQNLMLKASPFEPLVDVWQRPEDVNAKSANRRTHPTCKTDNPVTCGLPLNDNNLRGSDFYKVGQTSSTTSIIDQDLFDGTIPGCRSTHKDDTEFTITGVPDCATSCWVPDYSDFTGIVDEVPGRGGNWALQPLILRKGSLTIVIKGDGTINMGTEPPGPQLPYKWWTTMETGAYNGIGASYGIPYMGGGIAQNSELWCGDSILDIPMNTLGWTLRGKINLTNVCDLPKNYNVKLKCARTAVGSSVLVKLPLGAVPVTSSDFVEVDTSKTYISQLGNDVFLQLSCKSFGLPNSTTYFTMSCDGLISESISVRCKTGRYLIAAPYKKQVTCRFTDRRGTWDVKLLANMSVSSANKFLGVTQTIHSTSAVPAEQIPTKMTCDYAFPGSILCWAQEVFNHAITFKAGGDTCTEYLTLLNPIKFNRFPASDFFRCVAAKLLNYLLILLSLAVTIASFWSAVTVYITISKWRLEKAQLRASLEANKKLDSLKEDHPILGGTHNSHGPHGGTSSDPKRSSYERGIKAVGEMYTTQQPLMQGYPPMDSEKTNSNHPKTSEGTEYPDYENDPVAWEAFEKWQASRREKAMTIVPMPDQEQKRSIASSGSLAKMSWQQLSEANGHELVNEQHLNGGENLGKKKTKSSSSGKGKTT